MKLSGKLNTGNTYVTFDVAGDGNGDNYTLPRLHSILPDGTDMWQHFSLLQDSLQYSLKRSPISGSLRYSARAINSY
ncbi:Uncharacterised protein [Orientia tsutsugamushi]|nr:Uncharacterised protein [Orientia tsutsugamushi]